MGSHTGDTGALGPAATAAGERAVECRNRLAEFEDGTVVSRFEHVTRANQRLAEAIQRARAAEKRLGNLQVRTQVHQALRRAGLPSVNQPPALPARLVPASAVTPLAHDLLDWVSEGSVGVHDLWLAFLAYSGEVSFMEFDAYLHGAWSMSERDRQVLDQVCWEHSQFGTLTA
ncbi:hypothetical protein ACWEOW_22710 [Monashia sp. NPDC004114]